MSLVRRSLIRLYWIAVASNVVALAILLYDVLGRARRPAEVLAVLLTLVSVACWLLYFRKAKTIGKKGAPDN